MYDPRTAFSSIDHGGRYAFGNQPEIATWNLTRFAETVGPLIGEDGEVVVPRLIAALEMFDVAHDRHWTTVLRAKLGLTSAGPDDAAHRQRGDRPLGEGYLDLLRRGEVAFTLGWRALLAEAEADAVPGDGTERSGASDAAGGVRALLAGGSVPAAEVEDWLSRWRGRRREAAPGVDGIKDNEVLEGKTPEPVKSKFSTDLIKEKDTESSVLDYWYTQHFFASGVQKVRNQPTGNESGYRKVFFINKLKYQ